MGFFCLHGFQKPWERQNWRQFYLTGVKLLEVGCLVLLSEVLLVSYYASKIAGKWYGTYDRTLELALVQWFQKNGSFLFLYLATLYYFSQILGLLVWHASPTALLQRLARVIDLSRLPDFVYSGRPSKLLFTLNHMVVVHNYPRASQQYFLLNRSHLDNAQLTQLLTNFVDMIRMVLF